MKKSIKKSAKKITTKKPVKKSKPIPKKKPSKTKSAKTKKNIMTPDQVHEFIQHLSLIQNSNSDRASFHAFLEQFRSSSDRHKPIDYSIYTIVVNHNNDPIQPTDVGVKVNHIEPR